MKVLNSNDVCCLFCFSSTIHSFFGELDKSIDENAPQFEWSTQIQKEENKCKLPDFDESKIHGVVQHHKGYFVDLADLLSLNEVSGGDLGETEFFSKDQSTICR